MRTLLSIQRLLVSVKGAISNQCSWRFSPIRANLWMNTINFFSPLRYTFLTIFYLLGQLNGFAVKAIQWQKECAVVSKAVQTLVFSACPNLAPTTFYDIRFYKLYSFKTDPQWKSNNETKNKPIKKQTIQNNNKKNMIWSFKHSWIMRLDPNNALPESQSCILKR